jgi:DNA polymerase-1
VTAWGELFLTPEHAALLEAAAITPEVAAAVGVHSATEPGQVPTELQAATPLPALIFPWRSPSGAVEYQARPDVPTADEAGRARKYLWRRGMTPVLGRVLEAPDAPAVWIVEGTKQALAAASHAPEGVEVYGIGGCRMWMAGGTPITDLEVADGRDVVIILDADAAGNRDVYDAGMDLAAALRAEGAKSVNFVQLPGGKSAGLDDVLAGRRPDKRAGYLARLVAGARPKPAETKPKAKARGELVDEQPAAGERPVIVVNRDRYEVITELIEALRARWDGSALFNYGGALGWLEDQELAVVELGTFLDVLARTARTVTEGTKAGAPTYTDGWPDSYTIKAAYSRAAKFAPLERVARAPFVRADGSICTAAGYDEASRTVLVPDPELGEIAVPEEPTAEQVAAALTLLRDDWLADMPFEGEASRANALALILTPLVRGLVPRVPLAVVDGLQMGVGKNLFAECLMVFATGRVDDPKPYTTDEEEQRKFITAAFRSGDEVFVFDEAHELQGNALARALTSAVYSDRILGVSTVAKFPNRVTWVSLGNNVQVRGDVARRVYRIRLAPTEDNPQDRPQSSFRHPDLVGWTREHRAALIGAGLTLVRAWFAAGQPVPDRKTSFGSFEAWERLLGGILATAGQGGFLDNVREWRSESDFDTHYWTGHLIWLRETFGEREFSAGEVRSRALSDAQNYVAPPRLDDLTDKGYAKSLGEAYARIRGRRYDGHRLDRTGIGHRKIAKWFVEGPGTGNQDRPEGPEGPGGTPTPTHMRENTSPYTRTRGHAFSTHITGGGGPSAPSAPSGVSTALGPMVLDLETAGVEHLYRYGPGFVRLAGYTSGGAVRLTADIDAVTEHLRDVGLVIGHNVLGFDLPALARYHGLDIHALIDRGAVFDTLLAARHADPPPARGHRKYDLDALGERYGFGGKHGDLKKLAKEFGGFDKIPTDDQRYRDYLTRDVELNAALYAKLASPDPYLAREHQVAAIAAQISLNGFAVDEQLLAERVAEGEARKAKALEELAGRYGIPLVDDKGKRRKAPLATKAGKQALTEAFERLGAARLLRTPKAGDLMISADAMAVTKHAYGHLDGAARLCDLVATVTSERTIYETIAKHVIDGRVHPTVSMEQSTGRWSITKPGLTVVGKRGGRHREREVFLPDPGHVIVSVDLAQVDARAVAALSGDPAYAQLFAPGVDAHAEVARRIWGDASRREDAKAIGHGWNYGMGLEKLSREAGVTYETARQFDTAMREQFPFLVAWRDHVRELARSGELLDNGFGRRMRPDPERAHTQGPAFMGQGCARDLMMQGLTRLPREVYPYLRAVVHDEVVLSAPAADADDIERTVVDALSFEWRGVPIIADRQWRQTEGGKVPARGSSWGEVYAK